MIQKLKDNWLTYLICGIIGIWALAFFLILSASRECSQSVAMWEESGICLARSFAELSCFAGVGLAFGIASGLQAKAKKYPFIMGFLLGFFGWFAGGIIVLALSPRGERCPNCRRRKPFGREGLCEDCFWGRPPSPRAAISPEMKKRRVLVLVIVIITTLLFVFQILKNLGKI